MAANPIFVEAEEEVPGVIERIKRTSAEDVPLVLPLKSRFGQSRFNFQLLREYASRLGKRVTIVSSDPVVQRMAQENGFAAVSAVEQYGAGYLPPSAGPGARYGAGERLDEGRLGPTPDPVPYQLPFQGPSQAGAGPTGPPPAAPPPPAPLGWSMDAGSEPAPPVDPVASPWVPPPPSAPPPGVWSRQAFQAPDRAAVQAPGSGLGGRPQRSFGPSRSGAGVLPNRMRISMPTRLAVPDVKPGRFVFYGGAALVLLVGIIASVAYVPSAEVDMVAQAQPFSSNVSVSGDLGKQPIPIRVATASKSTSQTFNVAGAKVTPAQVAKGSVTFDAGNCFGQQFLIANGTRLHGPGGVAFATNGGDVNVGGQGSPQQQTSIVATQPGQQGNVAAGPFTFDNPGAGGCIQVNGGPTTGGADQQKKTQIQPSDLTTAQSQLDQALKQQITDQLSKGAKSGEKLQADQIQWKPTFTANHNVGEAAPTFIANLTEVGTAYYFHPDDVTRAFVDSLKKTVVPAGKQIAGDVSTSYNVTANQNGHLLTFSGKATGFLAPQLDSEAIKSQVTGRSPSQVKQSLRTRYPVQDVQVRQFPFGLPFMPLSASRVTVRYQILSGGSQSPSG
jgi:hypothetical protein